jgi:hypothetical protein
MAILDKVRDKVRHQVRHKVGHRWVPFFLPIIASLLYVLFATLLIPDSLSGNSGDADSDKDALASPIGSGSPADAAARLARRRQLRGASPRSTAPGLSGITPPPGQPPAPAVPAPIAPASPDGAD